jgi:tetratricopeptide (TPR) repeat protein
MQATRGGYHTGNQAEALFQFDQEREQIDLIWRRCAQDEGFTKLPDGLDGLDLMLWARQAHQEPAKQERPLSSPRQESYRKLLELFEVFVELALVRYPAQPDRLLQGALWYNLAYRFDDQKAQAHALFFLGAAHFALGQPQEASWLLDMAQPLADQTGAQLLSEQIRCMQGNCAAARGDFRDAAQKHQQALDMFRTLGAKHWEAEVLGMLAHDLYTTDREMSLALMHEQVTLARSIGDARIESMVLLQLGNAASAQKEFENALEYYQQSLRIARELKDASTQSTVLSNLGNIKMYSGHLEEARSYYHEAMALDEALGNAEGLNRVAWNLGLIYQKLGDDEQAVIYMRKWVDYLERINHALYPKTRQDLKQVEARLAMQKFLSRLAFWRT